MFSPIPARESAVAACAHRLRGAILGGEYAPNARLPPERQLAELFGVNRVTVRGALAHLAAEHLVRARQGSGYTVRDYRKSGGPDLIASLLKLATRPRATRAIVADLLLVRRHLARAVVERIEARRTASAAIDFAQIHAAIEALDNVVSDDGSVADIAAADLDVARAFVDISDSDVLRLCMNPIAGVLAHLPSLARAMFRTPAQNVLAWRAAVAALEARVDDLAHALHIQLEEADARTLAALDEEEAAP